MGARARQQAAFVSFFIPEVNVSGAGQTSTASQIAACRAAVSLVFLVELLARNGRAGLNNWNSNHFN